MMQQGRIVENISRLANPEIVFSGPEDREKQKPKNGLNMENFGKTKKPSEFQPSCHIFLDYQGKWPERDAFYAPALRTHISLTSDNQVFHRNQPFTGNSHYTLTQAPRPT